MCGRVVCTTPVTELSSIFGATKIQPDLERLWAPHFNIAPTQRLPIIFEDGTDRTLGAARWGLVPSWAKDVSMGARMFNARGETVASKPSFRAAFRKSRCIVAVDGFYEWSKSSGQGKKQPHFIHPSGDRPFPIAGLRECWRDPADEDADALTTVTILTTTPNEMLSEIHDRMPVILDYSDVDRWLAQAISEPEELEPLLKPASATIMDLYEVAPVVNSSQVDGPELIQPMNIDS